jgi:hypothetical protein
MREARGSLLAIGQLEKERPLISDGIEIRTQAAACVRIRFWRGCNLMQSGSQKPTLAGDSGFHSLLEFHLVFPGNP